MKKPIAEYFVEVYEVRFGIETKNAAGGYAEWSEIVLHWVQLTYSFLFILLK